MSARKQTSFAHRLVKIFIPHRHNEYRPWIGRIPGLFTVTILLVIAHVLLNGIHSKYISIDPVTQTNTSEDLLTEVNQARERDSIPRLQQDDRLTRAAQKKADHMLANQYWAHKSPDGTEAWSFISSEKYLYSESAENLARGFTTADGVIAGWQASPPHREAMLNANYSDVGFGTAKGTLNGEATTVVVALFAKPLQGAALANAKDIKKMLALQGASATFVSNKGSVEFSLLNPISPQSTLTTPGKVALVVLILLTIIYSVQHYFLRKRKLGWSPRMHEHPLLRLSLVLIVIVLIIATSFGSIG